MNDAVQVFPQYIKLSNEFRLLVAASWMAPSEYSATQASTIKSICRACNIDWDQFLILVDRHRIPALVYNSLQKNAADLVPEQTVKLLKERSTRSRFQAMRDSSELAMLLKILASNSIKVIPLKGVVLSQQLFNDPCLRHLKDLDIMVCPENIDATDQLLKKNGYVNIIPGIELAEDLKNYLHKNSHHFVYKNPSSGLIIELHWRAGLWSAKQTRQLWEHSIDESWFGAPVIVMNPVYRLLYLCEHGAEHKWFRLKWLSDTAHLIGLLTDAECKELLILAEELDIKNGLAQMLLLLNWLYGITLPKPFLSLMQERGIYRSLAESALTGMLLNDEDVLGGGKPFVSIRRAFYIMQLKPNMPKRDVLRSLFVCEADMISVPLPPGLFFLYIPLRPILWLKRYFLARKQF
ncbi:MAG: nucleotidyltransferase family protein [Desulfuromonadaceae bacterium]|nr:nucleotidyltransferase family protein [Desulfuromonadaceae bacterium]MDD2855991.1 nucleotidyltransferase family protein [Desulfuromonadaceae bacterium]